MTYTPDVWASIIAEGTGGGAGGGVTVLELSADYTTETPQYTKSPLTATEIADILTTGGALIAKLLGKANGEIRQIETSSTLSIEWADEGDGTYAVTSVYIAFSNNLDMWIDSQGNVSNNPPN